MKLPVYVRVCPLCDGTGVTKQMYTAGCGGGYYHGIGPCEICGEGVNYPKNGFGYVYKGTGKPISESVLAQIQNMEN